MDHQKLTDFHCPKCGQIMEKGYIAGHWTRLRWTTKANTKTIFAGTPLTKKIDFMNAPTISATRCNQCKIGMFSYDN